MKKRFGFPAMALGLISQLPAQQDPRVADALYRVSREASGLWQTAPHFIGRETLRQKVVVHRRGRGRKSEAKPVPEYETREIESFYSLGAFKGAPEALREFRAIVSVDGQTTASEKQTREKFARELASPGNGAKDELLKLFEKACLAGSVTDFGQLILLFTRSHLDKYSFHFAGDARIGADSAWLIEFEQQAGGQSLHISDGSQKIEEKLKGEISVRQGDSLPLRILLKSAHTRFKNELRDEATVDYMAVSGALLPAALTYRRFVNDELAMESIYRYSDWQPAVPQ